MKKIQIHLFWETSIHILSLSVCRNAKYINYTEYNTKMQNKENFILGNIYTITCV